MTTDYQPSSTRRTRRTKAAIQDIRDAIYHVVSESRPCTVRQVFYALVVRGVVEKTEAQYNNCVGRLLRQMRKDGTIPYEGIVDESRRVRIPATYDGPADALEDCARTYAR